MPDLRLLYAKDTPENKKLRGGKGFTLIEVLASVTVFSFILIAVCNLFILQLNFLGSAANRLDLQQNVRLAADHLTGELRYAETVQLMPPGDNPIAVNKYIISYQKSFNPSVIKSV